MLDLPKRTLSSIPILFLSLTAPLLPGQWSPRTTANDPPPRFGASLAWDGARNRAVLFGGAAGATLRGDTWMHDGIAWQQSPAAGPGARSGASMASDPGRGVVVLFGGRDGGGPRNDTWQFDGAAWTQVQTAQSPPARGEAAMAFDAMRGRMVLFGGRDSAGLLGDTWEYESGSWTAVNASSAPTPRTSAGCVYDPVRFGVLLFGGVDGTTEYSDLWRFDGAEWHAVAAPPGPAPRAAAAVAFDPDRSRLLVSGGFAGTAVLGDSWEFDGLAWQQVAGAGPTPRSGAAMTFDPIRLRALLFGGSAGSAGSGETWTWRRNPRPFAATFASGCAGRLLAPVAGSVPELGGTFVMDATDPGALVVAGLIGFSATTSGGLPLPRPLPVPDVRCMQRVDAAATLLLPAFGSVHRFTLALPMQSQLIGVEFFAQSVDLDGVGVVHASNGVEARVGLSPALRLYSEDFQSTTNRDADRSAGNWSGGTAGPALIGGDGRHGSFDPALGVQVGPGRYSWNTDNMIIPASRTMSGLDEVVTDGRFFFSDLLLPAGTTIELTGSNPPVLSVRGRAVIDGAILANARAMTDFPIGNTSNNIPTNIVFGQPGGVAGPAGGRGGKGGDRCNGLGPNVVGGVNLNDGQPGEDVRLSAGHAYALQAVGTGGPGSPLYPASGLNVSVTFTIFNAWCGQIGMGGGGGGFTAAGTASAITQPLTNSVPGPAAAGGTAFNPLPLPGNASALNHFLIGGSGGGGGGSNPFSALSTSTTDRWRAGAGGSGGGGAVAIRAGSDLRVGATGQLEAKGGSGFIFSGDVVNRVPAPGGGGSGGSVLLQSGLNLSVAGTIDTSGGSGSRVANVRLSLLNHTSAAGAGSSGFYRLESVVPAVSTAPANVPPFNPIVHQGPLVDRDARSGLASRFLLLGGTAVPLCLRYEVDATVNGVPRTFSDDPAHGLLADDPNGPVLIRFQAGRPGTGPAAAAVGPWRTRFGLAGGITGVNADVPTHVRFDIVFNSAVANSTVQAVRLFYR